MRLWFLARHLHVGSQGSRKMNRPCRCKVTCALSKRQEELPLGCCWQETNALKGKRNKEASWPRTEKRNVLNFKGLFYRIFSYWTKDPFIPPATDLCFWTSRVSLSQKAVKPPFLSSLLAELGKLSSPKRPVQKKLQLHIIIKDLYSSFTTVTVWHCILH